MSDPQARLRVLADRPVNPNGRYVLYWMIASRRTRWNYSLDRAVEWANRLGRPILIFEPLRLDYPWASDRFHQFVIDGMADTRRALEGVRGAAYLPYVEPHPGAGRGLLAALAAHASLVVTDDYPAFMLPRMVQAAALQVEGRVEAVDANGLLPMRVPDQTFQTAYAFRRFLHRTLPAHLGERPSADPLTRLSWPGPSPDVPTDVARRWPSPAASLMTGAAHLADLPIDHSVGPIGQRGGARAAAAMLGRFLDQEPGVRTARRATRSNGT